MTAQLDLLDLLVLPPASPPIWQPRPRREVMTRAACGRPLLLDEHDPEPFEIEVRGIPSVIAPGFCTHAILPAGSAYWSETGFRSFGYPTSDPDEVAGVIERYIVKNCGGRLTRWWPGYVLQWRQSLAFELSFKDRADVWNQWGPEKHEDCWHRHDMRLADAIEHMAEDGIDPNDVGPPAGFRGKWPGIPPAAIDTRPAQGRG